MLVVLVFQCADVCKLVEDSTCSYRWLKITRVYILYIVCLEVYLSVMLALSILPFPSCAPDQLANLSTSLMTVGMLDQQGCGTYSGYNNYSVHAWSQPLDASMSYLCGDITIVSRKRAHIYMYECPPTPQFCLKFLLTSNFHFKECPPSVSVASGIFPTV